MAKQVRCLQCGYLSRIRQDFTFSGGVPVPFESTFEIGRLERKNLREFLEENFADVFCFKGIRRFGDVIERVENAVNESRECKWYGRFDPGFSPPLHLELERESRQRRFLITIGMLSAAVGAVFGAIVTWLLTQVI